MHSSSSPSLTDKPSSVTQDRNLFRHIPLNSTLLENMNMGQLEIKIQ